MTSKAWVLSATEDADAGTVDLELLVPPTVYELAPSAMLDYTRPDAGYDGGGPYLYLLANAFSLSTDSADVNKFAATYKIRIVEADPADPASPLTWTTNVSAVTAASNRLTIADALGSFDTAKRYVVEFDDYATAVAAQTASYAFIGDDADRLIQDAAAVRPWSTELPDADATSPQTTIGFLRPYNVADDDGEPYSAAKVWAQIQALNNLKARVANGAPVTWAVTNGTGVTDAAGDTYQWAAGPFLVRYPPGATTLTIKAFADVSAGTGTVRATLTPVLPTGSATVVTLPTDQRSVTATTTATAPEELDLTSTIWPSKSRLCWLTLEVKNSGAGGVTTLWSVTAYIDSIPIE